MDPLLYIDRGLGYDYRKKWGRLIFVWSLLFLSLTITTSLLSFPPAYTIIFEALFLLSLSLYIANALMKIAFIYLYKERVRKKNGNSYEMIVVREKGRIHQDDVSGLINSSYGDETLKRLGIERLAIEEYLKTRRFYSRISEEKIKDKKINFPTYALILYDNDEHFAHYLKNQRIQREDLLHAAKLVENTSVLKKTEDRIFSNKDLHTLTPFEVDILKIEDNHNVYFTSPVIRRLSTLDEDEKIKILRKVLSNAKNSSRKKILVSDIHPDKLQILE